MRLLPVPSHQVENFWPTARGLLEKSIERSLGRYSSQTVMESLLNRDAQLWLVINGGAIAAAVTRIDVYATGLKTARLVLAAGEDIEKWVHFMDQIEEWARQHGCRYLEVGGRPGWERVLKWKKTAVELVKDLHHA